MTTSTHADLAAWTGRKRVRARLTDRRAESQEATCTGDNYVEPEAVAGDFRAAQDAVR